MAVLIFGVLMFVFGVISEGVVGSFAHLLDWDWLSSQRSIRGGHWVRLVGGRVFMIVGVLCIVGGATDVVFS